MKLLIQLQVLWGLEAEPVRIGLRIVQPRGQVVGKMGKEALGKGEMGREEIQRQELVVRHKGEVPQPVRVVANRGGMSRGAVRREEVQRQDKVAVRKEAMRKEAIRREAMRREEVQRQDKEEVRKEGLLGCQVRLESLREGVLGVGLLEGKEDLYLREEQGGVRVKTLLLGKGLSLGRERIRQRKGDVIVGFQRDKREGVLSW